jgi:IPT/TIG domain
MGHASEAYDVLAGHNTPAQTKAAVDAAYASTRANYKASQDGTAADFAEVSGLNPEITGLSPTTKVNGSGAFTLTVNGYDFDNGAVIQWAGANQVTTWVSSTQLTCTIAAGLVTTGTKAVKVVSSGGKTSNTINFTVT